MLIARGHSAALHRELSTTKLHSVLLLFLDLAQGRYGRPIGGTAVYIEYRSVARAIPTGLEAVPVQVTADMGATCRIQEKLARAVSISSNFLKSAPYNRALAVFQVIERVNLPWGDILAEAF